GADLNVACDGPSGRGPWMGRVIRSQHISNLKYEGYITDYLYTSNILRLHPSLPICKERSWVRYSFSRITSINIFFA
ncbi:hypothetical protein CBJ07_15530, partial [Salmonella enterica]|nr:hypothetical protein [Salmonella enterica]